jgi:Cro/C1-type HTH DNA-binding domain
MTAKLDYQWHLRQVMATRGMFATTDLLAPLAERGIRLSSSQVYRLVVERPERLSLKVLMALLDILATTMDELIEPVAAEPAKQTRGCRRWWRRGRRLATQACASHAARLVTVPPPPAAPPAAPVAAPAAMVDPIGTVVAVVTAVDPTLGREEVRRVVEQVSGGRAKRRRLATALSWDGSVLTSGRSPAPRVVGDLLLALRAAGATRISAPWCTSCGRELSAMQLRGQDWYCSPCYTRPQPCASCGQHRQVTVRDRHGRPRCAQCPDHDDRDPRQVLIWPRAGTRQRDHRSRPTRHPSPTPGATPTTPSSATGSGSTAATPVIRPWPDAMTW